MSREQDELIAERLFGWKWMAFEGHPWSGDKCRVRSLFRPEMLDATTRTGRQWRDKGIQPATGDEPLWINYVGGIVPPYTSDASADYQVLERIRQSQHDGMPLLDWESFLDALYDEVSEANKLRIRGHRQYEIMAAYVPGAYSRAALTVLNQEQPDAD